MGFTESLGGIIRPFDIGYKIIYIICAIITQIAIFVFVQEVYIIKPYTTLELYQTTVVVFAYASLIFGIVLMFLAEPKYLFYGGFLSFFMYYWMTPTKIDVDAISWWDVGYGRYDWFYPDRGWFLFGMLLIFFYFVGGYETLGKKYLE